MGVIFDQKNTYFEGEWAILIIQLQDFDEKLALCDKNDQIDGQTKPNQSAGDRVKDHLNPNSTNGSATYSERIFQTNARSYTP